MVVGKIVFVGYGKLVIVVSVVFGGWLKNWSVCMWWDDNVYCVDFFEVNGVDIVVFIVYGRVSFIIW